jgi:sugar phosphate isomerase/epimerase
MLQVCGAVGATVLVQHTGRVGAAPDIEIERLHAQERDALRAMGDIGARHGVKLAVETIWAFDRSQYTATAARLADEIRAVEHPFVCGALDFSHVYLYSTFRGLDFLEQVAAFAPVTGHLHVHDSFGRPKLAPIYAPSEELAFGLGDLHLPLGCGDIPWDDMLPRLAVRDDTVFMIELPPQFAEEAPQVALEAKRLIDRRRRTLKSPVRMICRASAPSFLAGRRGDRRRGDQARRAAMADHPVRHSSGATAQMLQHAREGNPP